jgi:small-conductance mechanosensitive channel
MDCNIFNNTIKDYIIFLLAFIIGFLLVRLFKKILLSKLYHWASKTGNGFLDFSIKTFENKLLPLIYFGVFYLSIQGLTLSSLLIKIINGIGLTLIVIYGVRFCLSFIIYGIEIYLLKKETDPAKKQVLKVISSAIKILAWILALIIILDNLGIKISALVTGLGIGGIAVALAAQVVLGDLFSYFTIYFDRPFETGDMILIGDFRGNVEHIGLKTTRLRSISGEQLICSNTDLTSSRLRNYKRMNNRRSSFQIGVSYQTNYQQLKEIPMLIADIIKAIPDTDFNRAHFTTFGEYSLLFDVVYYVTTSDYSRYMDIQQEINLKIVEEFEKRGIQFTYPTQTLYVNSTTK